MAYVVLVPDLARRPHYCFTYSFHVLQFARVFGGLSGFVPREEMTPIGNPFVEQQEIDFVKHKVRAKLFALCYCTSDRLCSRGQ